MVVWVGHVSKYDMDQIWSHRQNQSDAGIIPKFKMGNARTRKLMLVWVDHVTNITLISFAVVVENMSDAGSHWN